MLEDNVFFEKAFRRGCPYGGGKILQWGTMLALASQDYARHRLYMLLVAITFKTIYLL